MSSSSTICLTMIVKDEAHIIQNTLQHLLKFIHFSYWVICDTGSTDNTKEIITDFFNLHSIPGELIDTPWKDFGYNRT
jgi:glycosyltransferase involved in cell wall biosynthesis